MPWRDDASVEAENLSLAWALQLANAALQAPCPVSVLLTLPEDLGDISDALLPSPWHLQEVQHIVEGPT